MLSTNELENIENDVRAFRESMGIPDDEKIDMLDVLRRMRFTGEIADVSYETTASFAGSEARFDPEMNSIIVTQVSAKRQNARDRFTYAHEIGHKVGGHSFLRHRKPGKQFGNQLGKDEEYANAFAAAFLVPEHLAIVTERTTVDEIVIRFGVSKTMATHRLLELQRRFRNKHGIRRALPFPAEESEFDSGDYGSALGQMVRNSVRWNSST